MFSSTLAPMSLSCMWLVGRTLSQESFIVSIAEGRCAGFTVSIRRTNDFAPSDTPFHTGPGYCSLSNVYTPCRTLPSISVSLRPGNGGEPQSRMNRITPQLQMSHFSVYLPCRISGAM